MAALSTKEKHELLKKVTIFSDTDSTLLHELADAVTETVARTGSNIIRKGDPGDAMYVIVSGAVRIHDGNHLIARKTAGEVFGEYTLIDDETRSASVSAEEETRLLRLGRDEFYQIAAGNKEILRGVLLALIRRIREMNDLEEKLTKSYLKIRKQRDQIEKQNQNIDWQKEQLSQQNFDLTRLNEEKNHLISMVIHQIKNPLTSSLCMVEMMQADKGRLTDDQVDGLEVARKSLRRINSLLNEFLDVNAIDSKVFKLKMELLDLAEIIHELAFNYGYFIEQKNISIIKEIQEVKARMNRVYFTQIVDNLLSNAVKFTQTGGKIEIRLKEDKEKIVFTIQDDGPGMDMKKLDDIFNHYQRQGDMHTQHLPPEGLGLAIVHRYTKAMNGEVGCRCEPGKGTMFIVTFKKD